MDAADKVRCVRQYAVPDAPLADARRVLRRGHRRATQRWAMLQRAATSPSLRCCWSAEHTWRPKMRCGAQPQSQQRTRAVAVWRAPPQRADVSVSCIERAQHGMTPLLGAAEGGHTAVAERLLDFGANIDAQNAVRRAATCVACDGRVGRAGGYTLSTDARRTPLSRAPLRRTATRRCTWPQQTGTRRLCGCWRCAVPMLAPRTRHVAAATPAAAVVPKPRTAYAM